MDPAFLAALLGSGAPTAANVAASMPVNQGGAAPASVPPTGSPADVVVPGASMTGPNLHQGLIRNGTFSIGQTGGNILGMLGDAFLTQAGRQPQYAPRLFQQREAEALQDYGNTPDSQAAALNKLMMINPSAAVQGFNELNTRTRQGTAAEDVHNAALEAMTNQGRNILGGMFNVATDPKSFAAILKQAQGVKDRYSNMGIDLGDLPSSPEEAQQYAGGTIGAGQQRQLAALQAYRGGRIDIQQLRAEIAQQHANDQAKLYQGLTQARLAGIPALQQKADAATASAAARGVSAAAAAERARKAQDKSGGVGGGAFVYDPVKKQYVRQPGK